MTCLARQGQNCARYAVPRVHTSHFCHSMPIAQCIQCNDWLKSCVQAKRSMVQRYLAVRLQLVILDTSVGICAAVAQQSHRAAVLLNVSVSSSAMNPSMANLGSTPHDEKGHTIFLLRTQSGYVPALWEAKTPSLVLWSCHEKHSKWSSNAKIELDKMHNVQQMHTRWAHGIECRKLSSCISAILRNFFKIRQLKGSAKHAGEGCLHHQPLQLTIDMHFTQHNWHQTHYQLTGHSTAPLHTINIGHQSFTSKGKNDWKRNAMHTSSGAAAVT